MESIFEQLKAVNIDPLTKAKGKFNYLPWSVAVREAAKLFPKFTWSFREYDGLPYLKTELGYFVECSVTINELTRTQTMPVLDFTNKAHTSPTVNDINKSQMRALTKALALHGLGLDLWAGEDIFDESEEFITIEQQTMLCDLLLTSDGQVTPALTRIAKKFGFNNFGEIKAKSFDQILKAAQQCKS